MRIYVVSYGGCGSWLLVNYLLKLGVDAFHVHSRRSPNRICDVRRRKEIYNLESKIGWVSPKEKEWFDYKKEIKKGKIIYIHRNPIYSLLSNKSGNLYHFENLDINEGQHNTLTNIGFNYNEGQNIDAIRKYLKLKDDPLNYKEFFDNYHNCAWNENYDILSISFDSLWEDTEKICEFVNKKYVSNLPQKEKRIYNEELIYLSQNKFPTISGKLKIIKSRALC